jgi:hypothetical protein
VFRNGLHSQLRQNCTDWINKENLISRYELLGFFNELIGDGLCSSNTLTMSTICGAKLITPSIETALCSTLPEILENKLPSLSAPSHANAQRSQTKMRNILFLLLLLIPLTVVADSPDVIIDQARLNRLGAATMPNISEPISFDTEQADAILSALEIFPPDNPWNIPIDTWPVAENSAAIIEAIGLGKPLRGNTDMAFVLVPPNQNKIDVKLTSYSTESDSGPFPVPDNTPIEGWPAAFVRDSSTQSLSLEDVQRGKPSLDADRHGIVVDPVNRKLYEFYRLTKTDTGWTASQASIFDLRSNRLRPDGWTSSDAAGLPIFPAIVRYDELQRGKIEHALRATFKNTRRAYVYPATHFASSKTDKNLPRMGERFRLRKNFDTSKFSTEVRIVLEALKRYGMFNADNGIDWAVSIAPDQRIPVMHDELRKVKGSDFEVVVPPPGYTPPK